MIMKTFPNECPACGKPKSGGVYCAKCWTKLCKPESINCITAADKEELARLVAIKEAAGMTCRGEPLPLAKSGPFVQMMV